MLMPLPDPDNSTQSRASSWLEKVRRFLFADGGSLRDAAIRGGVWVSLGRLLAQFGSLIRIVVLARLLAPHDFGLMGIAMLALGCLETFSQTGYHAALVQRKGDIRPCLDTVFTIQLIRGVSLAITLYFVAPLIALFFRTDEAVPVVQATALVLLLNGLVNPAIVYFQKELQFRKQFWWQCCEVTAALAVGIVLAVLYRSVWALVISTIVSSGVRAVASYLLHEYRPRLVPDWGMARELSRYGKWVMGGNILAFLSVNLNNAVVGRGAGTVALGFYLLAYRISNLPATEVTPVLTSVAFPVYSKLQDESQKLVRVFFTGLTVAVGISLPLMIFLIALGRETVHVLLGEKWLPAVPALQILAGYGMLRTIAATGGALFQGVGEPRCDARMNLIRLVVLAVCIYPLVKLWGVAGAAWAAVLSIAAVLPYWLVKCAHFLQRPPRQIVAWLTQVSGLIILWWGLPVVVLGWLLPAQTWWGISLVAVASLGIYAVGCATWWNRLGTRLSAQ